MNGAAESSAHELLQGRILEMTGGWGGVGKKYARKGARARAHDSDDSGDEDEDRARRGAAAGGHAWFKPGMS